VFGPGTISFQKAYLNVRSVLRLFSAITWHPYLTQEKALYCCLAYQSISLSLGCVRSERGLGKEKGFLHERARGKKLSHKVEFKTRSKAEQEDRAKSG